MDWNWFFSSLAQSVAALVGIFAAFVITKIINNQSDFARKATRIREIISTSEKLCGFR
jgi:cytosine/uracil/thiamine/allantoin permease